MVDHAAGGGGPWTGCPSSSCRPYCCGSMLINAIDMTFRAAYAAARSRHNARIALVTLNSAISPAFALFVDKKRRIHQSERIIIFECHTILASTVRTSPRVSELYWIVQKGADAMF